MTGVRPIAAFQWADVAPGGADMPRPIFSDVKPTQLFVDETYQRNLSERSLRLIRKIVGDWDWRRFKPPVVVQTEAGLEVIDGQHTAIAAASHPGVTTIPVMIVDAQDLAMRAASFLGHNRDRLGVTATQMHVASVAAGDPTACAVDRICRATGVTILKTPPGRPFKPGECMAVAAIAAMVTRHGESHAQEFIAVLAKAGVAPVKAAEIRAVEMLMTEPDYAGLVSGLLTSTIREVGPACEREARVFALSHKLPFWKALGIIWFRKTPKRKEGRAAKCDDKLAAAATAETPAPPPVTSAGRPGSEQRSDGTAPIARSAVVQSGGRIQVWDGRPRGEVFGDPPPGRSALDEKLRGGGAS